MKSGRIVLLVVMAVIAAAVLAACKQQQQQSQWGQGQAGQNQVVVPPAMVKNPAEVQQLETIAKTILGNVNAWIALGNAQMDAQRFAEAAASPGGCGPFAGTAGPRRWLDRRRCTTSSQRRRWLMREARTHRMGYLVSRYPAVSHTFILREVEALRRQGFVIETASINRPDQSPGEMPEGEREAAASTYYVKAHGIAGALAAHASALLRRARSWGAGLVYALRLGGTDLRRIALGGGYFTEALMVGRWMRARGLAHLHVHFATAAANVGLCVKKVFGTSLSVAVQHARAGERVHRRAHGDPTCSSNSSAPAPLRTCSARTIRGWTAMWR